jgi:hypothetical protein
MRPSTRHMRPFDRHMRPSASVCAPQSDVCAPYASICAPPTCVCAPQPAVYAWSNPDHPTWQRCGSHRGQGKSRFTLSKVNKTLTLIGRTQTLSDVTDGQTNAQTTLLEGEGSLEDNLRVLWIVEGNIFMRSTYLNFSY